jgi:GalNAc-alpha-(1->4)-GalNAc-alpha-(1->3)-diNAcBac-PP-undecaprenol alpha-1,4-N-acetyl-D-galactosaminyltransferase
VSISKLHRDKFHVAFVIPSLGRGGAERSVALMANYWAERDWTNTIITFSPPNEVPAFSLHQSIHRVNLGPFSPPRRVPRVNELVRRQRSLRKSLTQIRPDIVVSFLDWASVETVIALHGLDIPVVAAVRSDPRHEPPQRLWRTLRSIAYRYCSFVVFQSEWEQSYFSIPIQNKSLIIPNAVPRPALCHSKSTGSTSRRIVSLGRLAPEKRFDLLISAFAMISNEQRDWNLTIWGEGPERPKLTRLRDSFRLAERVSLPGATTAPEQVLAEADLFVLTSLYEGFPNALCEAMASGLPVISFALPGAVSDIVRHQVDGMLVEPGNVQSLARVMNQVLPDENLRGRLGRRAIEVVDRFSVDAQMSKWTRLVMDLYSSRT